MNFIIRWIVTAIAVAAAVWIVPGIDIISVDASWVGITLFALILSLVNMSIKPILQVLSLPVTVLTLGIFYLIVNTLQRFCGLHRHLHRIGPRERPRGQRCVNAIPNSPKEVGETDQAARAGGSARSSVATGGAQRASPQHEGCRTWRHGPPSRPHTPAR